MFIISFICATILGMVFDKQFAEPENNNEKQLDKVRIEEIEDESDDNSSYATSKSEDEDENDDKGAIALSDDNDNNNPKFGNICVSNSSEVHFGNKTFYQGPVTIKQFVYANNSALECDGVNNGKLAINDDSPVIVNNVTEISDINQLANDKQNNINKCQINSTTANNNINKYTKLSKGIEWAKKHLVLIGGLSLLVIVTVSTLTTILVYKEYDDFRIGSIQDSTELDDADLTKPHIDPNRSVTLSGKLKIIGRREWLAQPPQQEITKLILPVPYVVIMHTATEQCFNQADCTFTVRYIQSFHIDSRKWWDIGYNFLVGGDGYVYEGRGWKNEGAHTFGYNKISIGIAFIGTFNNVLPTADQMKACQLLIEKGVNSGYIQTNYTLFAASQLSQTQSPGIMFAEELKTWPHFSLTPNKNVTNANTSDTSTTTVKP